MPMSEEIKAATRVIRQTEKWEPTAARAVTVTQKVSKELMKQRERVERIGLEIAYLVGVQHNQEARGANEQANAELESA
jgi:hypothetical protein